MNRHPTMQVDAETHVRRGFLHQPRASSRLIVGLLLALALVATACGQKAGVAGQNVAAAGGGDLGDGLTAGDAGGSLGGGAGGDAGSLDGGATTGDPAAGGADAGSGAATGTDAGATGGSGAAAGGAPGATASGGGAATGGAAASAGDRTGITDKEIVIGIHAPVTGAAPFPQDTFERGKDIYWKHVAEKGGVFGRNVRVVFRNDQYNPSRAVQVCREMVEKEKAFILVGGGGADQITACAKYANSVGVPYFSAGVNEAGLDNLRSYFAVSMSYSQQSKMLAQLVKNSLKLTKIGVVIGDTPSFADARASFLAEAKAAGLQVVYDRPYPDDANQGDALQTANALRAAGADAVYVLSSPVSFIYLAQAANGQAYHPKFVGPGISSGLNDVAEFGCPGVADARFLSPFPQLDKIGQLDPAYAGAYRKYGGTDPDDIGIALWALNKTLHTFFEAAGKDMSRQSLVATLESGRQFASGVFPPVKFSAGDHFGASQAHLLQADCGARQYRTAATFVSGF